MTKTHKKPRYYLDSDGTFVIENYTLAKPFVNFFPGIAGTYGIPMWTFYVNRGQAISSCGVVDKDHAIMEFYPANKAWQLVNSHGFRTFIKTRAKGADILYEPFSSWGNGMIAGNRMRVNSCELTIEEESTLGIRVTVNYFTIPNDSYAGLARVVTITNTSKSRQHLNILDGLPQIIPYGTNNWFLKEMSRTIEAWMLPENIENKAPFFRLTVDPTDRPEVTHIEDGNFYLSFNYAKGKPSLIRPVVDPSCVFGYVTDFSYPLAFANANTFAAGCSKSATSKTPCAFSPLDADLAAGSSLTLYTIIGSRKNMDRLNESIPRIATREYIETKRRENAALINGIQDDIATRSSSLEFDLYARQTYLDNVLRGGYPLQFKNGTVFYLYSRKHGDPERDYNKFHLEPTYFSQGNGNYRDINQNRRCDVWFHPQSGDENLVYFFNLIQTDGFNPLVVKGTRFMFKSEAAALGFVKPRINPPALAEKLAARLTKPFTPGNVALFIEEHDIKLDGSLENFMNELLSQVVKIQDAEHGEGFWVDHWTYNLDLLDAYLGLYPEKTKETLFEKRVFTFFDNSHVVRPRSYKYVLYGDHGKGKWPSGRSVKQLHAVGIDKTKEKIIRERQSHPNVVRTEYGKGNLYHCTLFNKLLCVAANKLASLDPFGVGIEMEAEKPNWYDALNGLPALFGSSVCETFELKRLLIQVRDLLNSSRIVTTPVTDEIYLFLDGLRIILESDAKSAAPDKDFRFWDATHTLKENYRARANFGFNGVERDVRAEEILRFAELALKKVEAGIKKARDKRGMYYAYCMHEVTVFDTVKEAGRQIIRPAKFAQKKLPYFLEGQMHALRLCSSAEQARKLHAATRSSGLYDKKLKMYKVTDDLARQPKEIGRCTVFAPGWLENESVFLHMEYKYLLEMLRKGLAKEFFAEMKDVLIPFQDAERYGRSILENCSFIASSAFANPALHGNGFVARLSGSTAEFLHMWLLMNCGLRPFFLNNAGELNLALKPLLPAWLFTRKDKTYTFKFLGAINVTYHNPKSKDTFAPGVTISSIRLRDKNGAERVINNDTIPAPYAAQVRARQITSIDVFIQ